MEKLNVIFIIVDTLRADKLGCYGDPDNVSPNIDRLAKESVIFENAYATINKTDPSIFAIFSGKYPLNTGLINHGIRITKEERENIRKIKTLPELLREKGYYTGAIDWLGRFHKRGFDFYSGFLSDDESETILSSKIYRYLRLLDLGLTKILGRDLLARLFYNNNLPYDPANLVTQKGIEFIKKTKKTSFFLYLHYWDPHFPYSRPNNLKSYFIDHIETRYKAEISFVDEHIGRFLDFLSTKNLLKKTLLIFTGDHGEGLNEHGVALTHRTLYEPIMKIPLIIHGPSLKPKRIKNLVQHPDIVPTILDFLNIDIDRLEISFDGESLLPLINNRKLLTRSLAFFEDISPGEFYIKKDSRSWGIRVGDYKFIRTFKGTKENLFAVDFDPTRCIIVKEELYNLKIDPNEKDNLINKKPNIAQEMAHRMDLFVKKLKKK